VKKLIGILFILFLGSSSFYTQTVLKVDTANVEVRKLSEQALNKYLSDKEFDYSRELAQKPVSWWDRFLNWLQDLIYKLFDFTMESGQLKTIIILGVLALIVYLLLKTELYTLFVANRKRAKIDFKTEQEDIHKADLELLINQSIENKEFRKAIRYLFLKVLKELDAKEWITWKISKTNYEYLSELKKHHAQSDFKNLSIIYEYIWYGDFIINDEQFEQLHILYKNYFSFLKANKT